LRRVRCVLRDSSELEHWIMKLTTKLRIPGNYQQHAYKVQRLQAHLGTVPLEGPSTES
jgi:hypothetical protein